MKRYFLINKEDGQTKAICDKKPKIEGGKLEIVEIDITKKQEADIKQGKQKPVIKNKKLTLKDFNE